MRLTHKLPIALILIFAYLSLAAQGTVYLVLGSDTAIWDGMSVTNYNCTYDLSLYTDPMRNASAAMDPSFRSELLDSYGQPMKMTWWMMAGNIFRYATNNDVPVNNIMTMYLMKKYHGQEVLINGDELSLHYHTFFWSDYDSDGIYFWNQSLTFEESQDDWDVTLAQFLLEENVFPVSFRSGWHYMDNAWQHELNRILPYSMHNAWPTNRVDTEEPLDNTYNWSESPRTYVPFRPSLENYMVPGDGPGWNVRSSSFQHVISANLMDTVFYHASEGRDQLACFWAHLPESDFVENMATLNDMAHAAAERYPGVDFRYCTAVEAMQMWRGNNDTTPPDISFELSGQIGNRSLSISSDEDLFQPQPFVAARYKDGSYVVLDCQNVDDTHWQINTIPYDSELSKLACAATDTMGNLSTRSISIVPDDQFLDNLDPGYTELTGTWMDHPDAAWGVDSRIANVSSTQPASFQWQTELEADSYYHIYLQTPDHNGLDCPITVEIESAAGNEEILLDPPFSPNQWKYVTTSYLSGSFLTCRISSALPDSLASAQLCADVLKLSANVRERDLLLSTEHLTFGEISQGRTYEQTIQISNRGTAALEILSLNIDSDFLQLNQAVPFTIESREEISVVLSGQPMEIGPFSDLLTIESNDPMHASVEIPIDGLVGYPFQIVDNEDLDHYVEFGTWATSVAVSYGETSRYAYLGSGASARFSVNLEHAGLYHVSEIVPNTINSANQALYILSIDNDAVDSIYINQNEGSGGWVSLWTHYLPEATTINVEVWDDGSSSSGPVLRADALKFQMLDPLDIHQDGDLVIPMALQLSQNYPNPFNPSTTIQIQLAYPAQVQLNIFDLKGRLIKTLADRHIQAGQQTYVWNAMDQSGSSVGAGVYLCQLQTADQIQTIKMILLK